VLSPPERTEIPYFQHRSAFQPRFGGTHFVARSGNGFRPHFHYGKGGVVIFDPLDAGGYDDLPGDDTVYQGQVAPQDAESLPYATPTSDPAIVISPYVSLTSSSLVLFIRAVSRSPLAFGNLLLAGATKSFLPTKSLSANISVLLAPFVSI